MREIIFRAKTMDTAEWIEGLYYRYDYVRGDGHFINTPDLDIAINLETLGQFTGLCDKNGTKIFEGDIVQSITEDTHTKVFAVIKFGKYRDDNFKDSAIGFYFELKGYQFSMLNGEAQGYDFQSFVEVVGNIYDNKDLLEGEN